MRQTSFLGVLCAGLACCCTLAWSARSVAADRPSEFAPVDLRQAIQAGEKLEHSRQWLNAIDHYESVVKQWPGSSELKYGLRRAKFQFAVERRYSDKSFDVSLLAKSRSQALDLFDDVLKQVKTGYVNDISSTSFVAHGTESFWLALNNEKFIRRHLPSEALKGGGAARSDRIKRMRDILRYQYWNKPIADRFAARETVDRICATAQTVLGLAPASVVMEYIFGGCNALDDYSGFLTPDRLNDLYDNIGGEFVGIGIEMKAEAGKGLYLIKVLSNSPAAAGGVRAGDYIVSINGIDCQQMTTDEAAGALRGPSGSHVRLEYQRGPDQTTRQTTLTRRPVQIKSIPVARIIDERYGIAYMQLTGFQKTSPDELDVALRQLRQQGMRALIWDVRGNPGGMLTAAVEILDRFLDEGVLVSTRGRTQDQNWTYSAHRLGTTNVPLVLLTDGDSASASEIVAGAVRDHRRGSVIGRTTFGKWSVQSIFSLSDATGLRLTTAKFYSPLGQTLGGVGLEPDLSVDLPKQHSVAYRTPAETDFSDDRDIQKGLDVLRQQLARQ